MNFFIDSFDLCYFFLHWFYSLCDDFLSFVGIQFFMISPRLHFHSWEKKTNGLSLMHPEWTQKRIKLDLSIRFKIYSYNGIFLEFVTICAIRPERMNESLWMWHKCVGSEKYHKHQKLSNVQNICKIFICQFCNRRFLTCVQHAFCFMRLGLYHCKYTNFIINLSPVIQQWSWDLLTKASQPSPTTSASHSVENKLMRSSWIFWLKTRLD